IVNAFCFPNHSNGQAVSVKLAKKDRTGWARPEDLFPEWHRAGWASLGTLVWTGVQIQGRPYGRLYDGDKPLPGGNGQKYGYPRPAALARGELISASLAERNRSVRTETQVCWAAKRGLTFSVWLSAARVSGKGAEVT